MSDARTSASHASAAKPARGDTGKWKLVAAALLVAGLIIASRALPVGDWLNAFNNWVANLGAAGLVIFVAVYLVATVLLVPGSILTLGAGSTFGMVQGLLAVWVGATLGAAAAFLIARHLARDAANRRFGSNARFGAVDRAVGREGARIVFLLRLSPVFPFNVLNYLLGVTAVRFWPYVVASSIGMLPGTLLYVYLGYVGRESFAAASGEAGEGNVLRYVYLGAGLIATLLVTIYVTRLARRALRHVDGDPAATPTTHPDETGS